jgi:hypothetical protein
MGSRILMALGLLVLFMAWIVYRAVVKRDLAKHKSTLWLGALFVALWGLLYWLWLA